jgi:hypothetical protein
MKLPSPRVWLPVLALAAAGTVGLAQIERLTLDQMVQKTDNAVTGTIVKSKVFRVDHPIDGPELYYTTLTIRGRSLVDAKPLEVDVTFPGGFISETEGVWNSEAPTADEIKVGNRVVAFFGWTNNMGGDVAANALWASHGGLYRVARSRKGDVVLGKGLGYAISSNVQMDRLDSDITQLADSHK